MTAPVLLAALAEMHSEKRGWIFLPELRLGTGYGRDVEQRLDGWAIQAWPSHGHAPYLRRAFEIKVDIADVTKELRNPDKRWLAYAVSHEFWFVAPTGLIDRKLLSKDDGLMEYDGTNLSITKTPRVREAMPPKWSFVAALSRRTNLK